MHLLVLGLNHKTAPVNIREKFAFSGETVIPALKVLHQYPTIEENVILSTCNRLEIWTVASDREQGQKDMISFLQSFQAVRLKEEEIEQYFYFYSGEEAVLHLFRVASGLDSLVLGEGQILGQLKEVYEDACTAETNGLFLNSLFKKAIHVGKKIRRTTAIGANAVSVSTVAVDLAKKFLGNLTEQKVLILGAGEMGELTAKSLAVRGVKSIIVANRNFDRAEALAGVFDGQAIHFHEIEDYLSKVDIVISSTGAPHYVLLPEQINSAMSLRKGKRLVLIDIAVPRDIDPEVGKIAGVALYDIDDLKIVLEENMKQRELEAQKALKIIEEEIAEFKSWVKINPVVALLRQRIERLRVRELEHALENKFSALSNEDEEAVEKLTLEIMNKILDLPISAVMKRDDRQQQKIEALVELFHLPPQELQKLQLDLA